MPTAVVFIEQRDNKFKRASLEALSAAADLGTTAIAVVIGSAVKTDADTLARYGAKKVFVFEHANLLNYSATAYAKLVAKVVKEESATLVFLAATALGKDLAPRLAVRLGAGLVSDAVELSLQADKVVAKRYAYSGKAIATVELTTSVQIFSLRPNVFPLNTSHGETADVIVSTYEPDSADLKTVVKEIVASSGKLDVTEADIVVSGGRGMKGPEHFHLVEELAQTLGGAVGASRAIVDAGWRPHSEQVGQTGKVVSPKLYIACGISGAVQHLAGMASSKIIVAINKDKDAPIFQVADYGIVGDALEILPQLNSEFKKILSHN
ncbi:MAG: electron transfer flavoprotein subunit alpha [[Candidatus Thermochlorobacteriaceae] bacterium GBChlB]|nr:MAG: electron transfer flavoprotein subunit alpha [[Candidatus Thermochlorobacteriaceae] bacterium GBChlB]